MGNSVSDQELVIENENLDSAQMLKQYCLGRKSLVTQDLIEQHPARIFHPHKQRVYEIACSPDNRHNGTIVCSRYKAIPLAKDIFQTSVAPPQFEMREDVFDYKPNNLENTVEWHVNFADPNLFTAYGGGLFAQDEMQVAEHPSLGHLKEALNDLKGDDDGLAPFTRENNRPTPILVRGVERRCMVKTDVNAEELRPHGLYGNSFARASKEAIEKATVRISPPTTTNLICMAALGGGQGRYTLRQIVDIFTTAYTSFRAAVVESELAINNEQIPESFKKPKVIIHTGNWGTGAVGGNKPLMAIIQLSAAWMAGVDKMVYHTVDRTGSSGYNTGKGILDNVEKPRQTEQFLNDLYAHKFLWGFSDGN